MNIPVYPCHAIATWSMSADYCLPERLRLLEASEIQFKINQKLISCNVPIGDGDKLESVQMCVCGNADEHAHIVCWEWM